VNKPLRIVLLSLGAALFAYLIYKAGPTEIARDLAVLGPWLPVVLIPYALSYSLDTLGWRATLGAYKGALGFGALFLTRLAGEAVNNLTPSAYLGGEPLKAYLLKKAKVPLADGFASVIIAKTAITMAHMLFILLGIVLAYTRLAGVQGLLASTLVVVAFFILIVVLAGWVQRRGLFDFLSRLLTWLHVPTHFLKKRETELNAIDRTMRRFYREDKLHLVLSVAFYFLGWIAGAFEVYLLLLFLRLPVGVGDALAIEALVSLIRAALFFLPAGLGAQEGGNLFLFYLFGLPKEAAMTYSILRRLRELILIGTGLTVLAQNELKPKIFEEVEVPLDVPGEN
jgi:putative membrane protein